MYVLFVFLKQPYVSVAIKVEIYYRLKHIVSCVHSIALH